MKTLLVHWKAAFLTGRAATFKQVVLVEFPRPGLYSIGFLTGAQNGEVQAKTRESLLSVSLSLPLRAGQRHSRPAELCKS